MKTYQFSQRQPSLKVATVFLKTPDNVQSVITTFCDTLGPMESMLTSLHSPTHMEDSSAIKLSLLSPLLPRESWETQQDWPFLRNPADIPCPACCTHFCIHWGSWRAVQGTVFFSSGIHSYPQEAGDSAKNKDWVLSGKNETSQVWLRTPLIPGLKQGS